MISLLPSLIPWQPSYCRSLLHYTWVTTIASKLVLQYFCMLFPPFSRSGNWVRFKRESNLPWVIRDRGRAGTHLSFYFQPWNDLLLLSAYLKPLSPSIPTLMPLLPHSLSVFQIARGYYKITSLICKVIKTSLMISFIYWSPFVFSLKLFGLMKGDYERLRALVLYNS